MAMDSAAFLGEGAAGHGFPLGGQVVDISGTYIGGPALVYNDMTRLL